MELVDLPEQVQSVIKEFIEPYILDPNVVGIMLVGSYVNSVPDENSDLDIYIVQEDTDVRERGNIYIDELEIEYFLNPIMQIYQYMDEESIYRPNTVHMIATGLVLYKQKGSNHLDKLISEAKRRMELPLPELSDTELELAKYFLDDTLKDALDMIKKGDKVAYHVICAGLLQYSIGLFFKLSRMIFPKIKHRIEVIKEIDYQFAEAITNMINTDYSMESLETMIRRLETLVGGKRSRTWKLKGSLTFISKSNDT